jgi:cysteine desulfurase
MRRIYLDHNATSPIDSRVVESMTDCYARYHANPASQHRSGQAARRALEDARERIAAVLGIDITSPAGDRLIFTSGGTEANNFAVRGLAKDRTKRVIVSAIEHPSVLDVARDMAKNGIPVDFARVTHSGIVDLDRLREWVDETPNDIQLVSVMMANNETGMLQPLTDVVELCEPHKIPVHTDAVQAIGKMPIDFDRLGVSTLSLSAHKIQGPAGIGALAVRQGVSVEPLIFGGQQQLGQRPGTETVALAVGMATAVEIRQSELDHCVAEMARMRNQFEQAILASGLAVQINGGEQSRLCQTSNLSFLGIDRQALLLALDFAGIDCATGSACSSGSSEPSHVLVAMGLSSSAVNGALRFSFGPSTTAEEISQAADRIIQCVRRIGPKGKSGAL